MNLAADQNLKKLSKQAAFMEYSRCCWGWNNSPEFFFPKGPGRGKL